MLTEKLKAGFYLVSEANGDFSRDQATLTGAAALDAGSVLGYKPGTQTVAAAVAFSGNTGNGVFGTPTADPAVQAGDWKVVIVAAATNAGHFEVFRPDGTLDGTGNVAAAYNGGINFTLADGGTDFVAGDGFTINVSYAAGKYAQHDPSATDGTQNAAAILYDHADATDADVPITITARGCEVNAGELVWKSGITDNQKAAALAQLAALGIIAR